MSKNTKNPVDIIDELFTIRGLKTTMNILELGGLCHLVYLQMSQLVLIHYFLGKTTKNSLELAKDLGGLTGNS